MARSDDENTVFAVSLLNPALLDGAIMLGANFERSMLYDWFRRYHGVRFEEFEPIKQHLKGRGDLRAGKFGCSTFPGWSVFQ